MHTKRDIQHGGSLQAMNLTSVVTKSAHVEAYWKLCTGVHAFPVKHYIQSSLWELGHS